MYVGVHNCEIKINIHVALVQLFAFYNINVTKLSLFVQLAFMCLKA